MQHRLLIVVARLSQIFNILCEQPETVAAFLVPRVRTIAARGEASRYVRFLTLPRALLRFVTAPLRSNRFFGPDGGCSGTHHALASFHSGNRGSSSSFSSRMRGWRGHRSGRLFQPCSKAGACSQLSLVSYL
jgi:hypothetical protein